jgi:O-glycosyl hydrolase
MMGTAPVLAATALDAVASAATAGDVVVDLSAQRQTIRGFGGINHPVWIDDLTPPQRETAFGNGSNQLGFSVLRIFISENRADWSRGLETARRAIEHGAIVFASPWNPPTDMIETVPVTRKQGNGTTYQAETETTLVDAAVANSADGFTGSGFVEFHAATGASLQWNGVIIGSTGRKNLEFRYALESGTRHLDVYVDGAKAESEVAFEATGSWSTWAKKSIQVPMTAGTATVRVVTTGTGGPNIDSLNAAGLIEDPDGRRLRHDKYDAYARHLNDFNAFMQSQGVDLYALSIQNEPDFGHDWTWWTNEEILRFMKENAGSIDTKVIAPESFQYVKDVSDPILNDPEALANLDILGTHLYGTKVADFPYPLFKQKGAGKELWMTEVYHPNSSSSADLWPEALDVAEHIHHAMVDAEFQTYVWWYIRRFYGPITDDGTISKRGYNMAHFSKFVRPGYVRVDATATPQPEVFTSAYTGDRGKVVVVAVSKNTSPVRQTFTLQNAPASMVSSWLTDESRNLRPQAAIDAPDGTFTADLPAQSVTTFVAEPLRPAH